jgi:hypothetical protein
VRTDRNRDPDDVRTPPEARQLMKDHPGWDVWVGLNSCWHGRLRGTTTLVNGDNAQDIRDGIANERPSLTAP